MALSPFTIREILLQIEKELDEIRKSSMFVRFIKSNKIIRLTKQHDELEAQLEEIYKH
jgi:hypothetical protein